MFGWLPIIGPVIDGIVSIFTKKMDSDVEKYKVDGQVDVAAMQAQTSMVLAFKDDIAVRLARDLIMFPVCLWTMLVVWDKIVASPYPELIWGVDDFKGTLVYLPYAVLAFLFGNAYLLRK